MPDVIRGEHDFRHMAGRTPLGYDRSVVTEERIGTVFQVGGLIAWAMVGVDTFLKIARTIDRELVAKMPDTVPPEVLPKVMGGMTAGFWVIALAAFLAFGLAFRATTRRIQPASPSVGPVALLALQFVLALGISSDLLYIVAAEIPFVLRGRAAIAWFAGQAVVSGALAFSGDEIELLSGAVGLPTPLAVALSVCSAIAWQALAFSAGFIAAAEARRRRELARLNAELLATQQVLAQSARVAERSRIARDLHDTLGHHLAALSVNLELASRLTEPRAAQPIDAAKDTARLLLSEVRNVVSAIRTEGEVELKQALAILASGIERPRVHLALPSGPLVLSAPAAHALFRAAQEAITNTVRHASAANLWIEVQFEDGGVTLSARDDGLGAPSVVQGNGLRGMRERLEALGGTLAVESRPKQGFTLIARIPVRGATP